MQRGAATGGNSCQSRVDEQGRLIVAGKYDAPRAEHILQQGLADLVAFGRPFIANPDLVERIAAGAPLAKPDYSLLYTGEERGYTDYPAWVG